VAFHPFHDVETLVASSVIFSGAKASRAVVISTAFFHCVSEVSNRPDPWRVPQTGIRLGALSPIFGLVISIDPISRGDGMPFTLGGAMNRATNTPCQ
jgi:hypothetical protein